MHQPPQTVSAPKDLVALAVATLVLAAIVVGTSVNAQLQPMHGLAKAAPHFVTATG